MDHEQLVFIAQQSTGEAAEEAFAGLIDRFWNTAVSWAYTCVGDLDHAQDAAQEAFISAYRGLDTLREPRAFPAWLRRLVITQSMRTIRDRTQSSQSLDDESTASETNDPARVVEIATQRNGVREAVRALPDHERSVTELFYLDGYSQREIAEVLALPLTTVKKRLQYARERLRGSPHLIDQIVNQVGVFSGVAGDGFPGWENPFEVDELAELDEPVGIFGIASFIPYS
ncbi:MAG: sigma-70 family RNA polymerase sigma factor [Anaerolineae bacterium]|nr:sigma-70 family RNA polymerase sigma factor [Anaerolineae bacterium]